MNNFGKLEPKPFLYPFPQYLVRMSCPNKFCVCVSSLPSVLPSYKTPSAQQTLLVPRCGLHSAQEIQGMMIPPGLNSWLHHRNSYLGLGANLKSEISPQKWDTAPHPQMSLKGCHQTPPAINLEWWTGVLTEIQSAVCPLFAITPCLDDTGKSLNSQLGNKEITLLLVRYMCGYVVS